MKRYLNISLVIVGAWILLFSAKGLIHRSLITKEHECKMIEYEIDQGKCAPTNDLEGLYEQRKIKGFIKLSIQLLIGLLILSFGTYRIIIKNNIRFSMKGIFEIVIHVIYWILFVYGIGILVRSSWGNMDSCGITWIYLFLLAASIGFYGGYYINNIDSVIKIINVRVIKWLFIFSFFGGLLSYFPLEISSGISSGNFKPIFSIQSVLVNGFFCFISFIHVFIGFLITKNLRRLK